MSRLLLLIDAALARNLFTIVCIFSIGLTLALFSRVPVGTLVTRAWLGALVLTGVIAVPSIFITPGHVVY